MVVLATSGSQFVENVVQNCDIRNESKNRQNKTNENIKSRRKVKIIVGRKQLVQVNVFKCLVNLL